MAFEGFGDLSGIVHNSQTGLLVAGLRLVDALKDKYNCFWRWMNFAGWIAIKE